MDDSRVAGADERVLDGYTSCIYEVGRYYR